MNRERKKRMRQQRSANKGKTLVSALQNEKAALRETEDMQIFSEEVL